MAQKLKFGNGTWATKEGSTLAYNDENENYKPLPFNFERDSIATRINKDGLIETVGGGQARIDFKDDSKGALLLEPSRTNLVTYSQDFSQWNTQGSGTGSQPIITSNNTISPDGNQNADKIVFNKGTGVTVSDLSIISSSSFTSQTNTASFYIKADIPQKIVIRNSTNWQLMDVTTEWQRISKTDTGGGIQIGLRDGYGIEGVPNTATVYLWGAQAEQGSYPTSYIPTQGGVVTRLADVCSQTPPSGIIGQTEGTLFFDVNISHIVGDEALGGINSGGYANHVTIQRIGNTIQFVRNSATQSGATIVTSSAITVGRYRLALAYKSGDTACFLNGTQVSTTQTQTFTNATLNLIRISGDAIGALPFADTYNQSQLYNTRLSNSELAALTTI